MSKGIFVDELNRQLLVAVLALLTDAFPVPVLPRPCGLGTRIDGSP